MSDLSEFLKHPEFEAEEARRLAIARAAGKIRRELMELGLVKGRKGKQSAHGRAVWHALRSERTVSNPRGNREIAAELGCTHFVVSNYRRRMRRLGILPQSDYPQRAGVPANAAPSTPEGSAEKYAGLTCHETVPHPFKRLPTWLRRFAYNREKEAAA